MTGPWAPVGAPWGFHGARGEKWGPVGPLGIPPGWQAVILRPQDDSGIFRMMHPENGRHAVLGRSLEDTKDSTLELCKLFCWTPPGEPSGTAYVPVRPSKCL